jgi:hypothetical protein
VALGVAAASALAGCGTPAGVDTDLTDDWARVAEPTPFVPAADTCHPDLEGGPLSAYNPVDCGSPHRAQTVHVGRFPAGTAADGPPESGSPAYQGAYRECLGRAGEVLGADPHTARLRLGLVLPSAPAWGGGARWFRCDVNEVVGLDDGTPAPRTGTLRGALKTGSPLSLGCFRPKLVGDNLDSMAAVSCTSAHRAEFAGVFTAPEGSYDQLRKDRARTNGTCLKTIASFAKLPDDGDLERRVGVIVYTPGPVDWADGDRTVRCFLWNDVRDLKRSMKGAGPGALPAN